MFPGFEATKSEISPQTNKMDLNGHINVRQTRCIVLWALLNRQWNTD